MKEILFSIIFISIVCSTFAQNAYKGIVLNDQHKPIELAEVSLFSVKDSSFIIGTITNEDGLFSLTKNITDSTYLKISSLGYQPLYIHGTIPARIIIHPDAITLKGVVVKGRKEILKHVPGKWIATIENSYLSNLGNANDVLNQLPMVQDDDGQVNVIGKGTPEIYINNRKVYNVNELRQLKSNEIKHVEVITTPGAEYNSSVKSVIKIYLLPHKGDGLSGSVDVGSILVKRFSEYAETALNYRYKGMDIFVNGDLEDRRTDYKSRNRYVTSIASDYNGLNHAEWKYGELGGGINYMPNENQSVGFKYNWTRTPQSRSYNHSDVSVSNDEYYETASFLSEKDYRHYLNVYYSGKFDKLKFDFNTDYSAGKNQEYSNTDELKTDRNYSVTFADGGNYNLSATKLVLTYSGKNSEIVAGGEYDRTLRKNFQHIYSNTEDNDLPTTNNKVKQHLWAVFVSWNYQLGKWYFSSGIRYEHTGFDYYELSIKKDNQSKIYHNLFPELTIGFDNKTLQAELSYNRGIDRPSYASLDNVVSYKTDNVRVSGNPFLLPEMSSTVTLYLSLNYMWSLYCEYDHLEKDIAKVNLIYRNNPEVMVIKPVNLSSYNRYMAILSYNTTVAFWHPRVDAGMQWQDLRYGSPMKNYNIPVLFMQFRNIFQFAHDWQATTNWRFQKKSDGGVIYNTKNVIHLDISLSKYFLKKSLQLKASVTDLFNQGYTHLNTTTNNLSSFIDESGWLRKFRISIAWFFNKTNKRYKGKGAAGSELNRI